MHPTGTTQHNVGSSRKLKTVSSYPASSGVLEEQWRSSKEIDKPRFAGFFCFVEAGVVEDKNALDSPGRVPRIIRTKVEEGVGNIVHHRHV